MVDGPVPPLWPLLLVWPDPPVEPAPVCSLPLVVVCAGPVPLWSDPLAGLWEPVGP